MSRSKIVLVLALSLIVNLAGEATAYAAAAPQSQPPAAKPALTEKQLDELLAPIALYPDALLAQMLMCAGSPYQVKELNEWLKKNSNLKGSAVQEAAEKEGFDASYIALSTFPQVAQMMADKPDWTRKLGQAFKDNKDGVFASVQRLRKQAKDLGNLKTTPQQEVKTEKAENGQQVIVVQPTNPQVIYVPTYNPQVVYVQAPPPTTTVVVTQSSGPPPGTALVAFTAGVIIGAAASNNYYWGPYGWRGGYMYGGGWNNYYEHRENMAQDYYQHRENMAGERTERQGNRQEGATERTGTRQEGRTERQGQRQDSIQGGQATPAGSRPQGTNQSNRAGTQPSTTNAQGTRQGTGAQQPSTMNKQGTGQAGTRTAKSTPSSFESRGYSGSNASTAARQSGGSSGAFSGYSGGKSEKAASSRGRSSASSSGRSKSGGGRRGRS